MTVHQPVNMPGATPPRGYSDAVLAGPVGRLLVLGGHVAFDAERRIVARGDIPGQVGQIVRNLKATLAAAGAGPEHLVKLTIHTLDVPAYRARLREIGEVWRRELGCTYPAMTLLGVAALFDDGALVEIDGLAVLPPAGS